MTISPKKKNLGKWAEAEAEKWLKAMNSKYATFAYHRYPDARAARGALASQPADFLVAFRGAVWNLEVKETAQPYRLPKAKISQYGKLKLFEGAGVRAAVLVYRSAHADWIVLTGEDLFTFDDGPASFLFSHHQSFFTADEALNTCLT